MLGIGIKLIPPASSSHIRHIFQLSVAIIPWQLPLIILFVEIFTPKNSRKLFS
jgi:hypothetical protein